MASTWCYLVSGVNTLAFALTFGVVSPAFLWSFAFSALKSSRLENGLCRLV